MNARTAFAGLLLGSLLAGCATSKPEGLLFHCTFDDEASITTPAVGPAGKLEDKVAFVPGKFGNAVQTGPGQRAAVFELPAGTIGERGTIECWAKITDPNIQSLPPSGSPMIFIVGVESEKGTAHGAGGYINWNGNDGGQSGLCGWMADARFVCERQCCPVEDGSVYSALLGDDVGGWHHYAVTWDIKGLDKEGHQALIILDNRVVATAGKMNPEKLFVLANDTNTLSVPINGNKFLLKRGVEIDELRIWNKPLTAFRQD